MLMMILVLLDLIYGRFVIFNNDITILCGCGPQVKSGTIFDNFLITDDEEYAVKFGKETWGATKDPEKKMKEAVRLHPL